ncbi:uncharacterized protein LOC112905250 isoform X2 [Agrilus planipennis]|uniref:Uncharacterized protein LOC112905250 isoform X2 n=1 Tax=Agrilus planipennis TaxID=224129 RepID=A0A7F5RAS5_AGRPL|nr:uncharacterized protein LOC112905250 isoform X2 [Agrilus planipennis]
MELIFTSIFMGIFVLSIALDLESFSFIILMEHDQEKYKEDVLQVIQAEVGTKINTTIMEIQHDQTDAENLCSSILSGKIPIIIDFTWNGNDVAQKMSIEAQIYYLRIDISIAPILKFLDMYLERKKANDVTIFFDDDFYVEQSIFFWLNSPRLRLFITTKDGKNLKQKLSKIIPIPSTIAIIANTKNMINIMTNAVEQNAFKIPDRVIILFSDLNYDRFSLTILNNTSISMFKISKSLCCFLQEQAVCTSPENFDIQKTFLKLSLQKFIIIFKSNYWGNYTFPNMHSCNETNQERHLLKLKIQNDVSMMIGEGANIFETNDNVLEMKLSGTIEKFDEDKGDVNIGSYANKQITTNFTRTIEPIRKFYRIGIAEVPVLINIKTDRQTHF